MLSKKHSSNVCNSESDIQDLGEDLRDSPAFVLFPDCPKWFSVEILDSRSQIFKFIDGYKRIFSLPFPAFVIVKLTSKDGVTTKLDLDKSPFIQLSKDGDNILNKHDTNKIILNTIDSDTTFFHWLLSENPIIKMDVKQNLKGRRFIEYNHNLLDGIKLPGNKPVSCKLSDNIKLCINDPWDVLPDTGVRKIECLFVPNFRKLIDSVIA